MEAGPLLMAARLASGLSQRELAERAGTSGATIAAYETGAKEPRLSTLSRLIAAAGSTLVVDVEPGTAPSRPLTREQRRSLALHRAVAARLVRQPDAVLEKARANLHTLRAANTGRNPWINRWETLLAGPPEAVLRVLLSHDEEAHELRQNSPFAGLLSDAERRRAIAAARR